MPKQANYFITKNIQVGEDLIKENRKILFQNSERCQEILPEKEGFGLCKLGEEKRENKAIWGRREDVQKQGWHFMVLKMPSTSVGDACYIYITSIPYSRTKPQ